MKESKKFLSLILCLAMAITMLPCFGAEAFADGTGHKLTLNKGANGTAKLTFTGGTLGDTTTTVAAVTSNAAVTSKTSVTLSTEGKNGYMVDTYTVSTSSKTGDVASGTALSLYKGTTTFTMPDEDVAVNVTFRQPKLQIASCNNGEVKLSIGTATTITDTNPHNVLVGDEVKITVTPSEGYVLDELLVYQTEYTAAKLGYDNYVFTMIDRDITVKATFKALSGDIDWYENGSSPYVLYDMDDVKGFADLVNGTLKKYSNGVTFNGSIVKLADNFNSAGSLNTPIGNTQSKIFEGKFDGNGKVINLNITSGDYAGLFGNVGYNALIANVGVSGSVNGTNKGAIVGRLISGYVVNCYSTIAGLPLVGSSDTSSKVLNCYSVYDSDSNAAQKGTATEAMATSLNTYVKSTPAYNGITLKSWEKSGSTIVLATKATVDPGSSSTGKYSIEIGTTTHCSATFADGTTSKFASEGDTIRIKIKPSLNMQFDEVRVYSTKIASRMKTYSTVAATASGIVYVDITMQAYDSEIAVYCSDGTSLASRYKSSLTTNFNNGKKLSDYLLGGKRTTNSSSISSTRTSSTTKKGSTTTYYLPSRVTDVSKSDWFYQPVAWAINKKVADTIDNSHFYPYQPTTRAEMITFIWKAEGSPTPRASLSGFVDVATSAAYNKAVIWALEEGITDGTSATTFSPNSIVTRAQAVAFLARLNGVSNSIKSKTSIFKDVKTTDYYNAAVIWAYNNYITEGTSALYFSPNNICTRGEIITFVYRAYN